MKKVLTKRIVIASVISFLFMIIVVFAFQSFVMVNSAKNTAKMRVEDVVNRIESNDIEISKLTKQLNEEFILKANTFAEMIKINPSIINDSARLDEIARILNVEELHVTDDKGVIRWGTIPEYFGFDFATSEQTKEFMPILNDSDLKIAQNPQPNGAEGKMFQYISVARMDKKGIVQVGVTPNRLTEAIESNSIANVLKTFTVGKDGYVFAVSKKNNKVVAHKNEGLIGKASSEICTDEKIFRSGAAKFAKIDGENTYCYSGENDDYIIIAAIPKSEVYSGRAALLIVFVLAILIMLGVIIALINSVMQNIIIKGINEILNKMKVISGGDLDVTVDVNTCPEYTTLSRGINAMLSNIRENMSETFKLNEEQKRLFNKIGVISADVSSRSADMKEIASKLSAGSSTQAATVEEISASVVSISQQIKDSADAAKNAKNICDETTANLDKGAQKLKELEKAMAKIQESSTKIGKIVKTIEDISFQTNILALNAAVEAASAGEHGKGFAVVADEVRTLATKSADAVNGTTVLIEETMNAVSDGANIANETAQQLKAMIEGVSESNKLIDNISEVSEKQAEAFTEISDSINQIAQVAQQNAQISYNAETTAQRLDEETQSLEELFKK